MIARSSGFTLIELLVAIFIFSMITVAIVSVFVSSTAAHQKSRAIKTLKEDVEYAMSSIAKEIRMGKIESTSHSNGGRNSYIMLTRNRGGKVCYYIHTVADESYLGIAEGIAADASACPNPSSTPYKRIVDLSGRKMNFSANSGFYSCPSAIKAEASCPSATTPEKRRGWAEINLNIEMGAGSEMESDQINVQTVVSSRDYGWEDI